MSVGPSGTKAFWVSGTSTCAIMCVVSMLVIMIVCLWDKVEVRRGEGLKDCGVPRVSYAGGIRY